MPAQCLLCVSVIGFLIQLLTDDGLPVDSGDNYEMSTKVSGLFDAGKGMIQQLEYQLLDKRTRNPVARWVSTQFIIGAGGFGGAKRPKDELAEKWKVPKRNPDKVMEEQTTPEQAIICEQKCHCDGADRR